MELITTKIKDCISYLSSPQASNTLSCDVYWPKWHSPWWHMLLLHEMGEAKQIPKSIVDQFVDGMKKYPLKIFPINDLDLPKGICPYRGYPCHCQLGNVYQVLYAVGVNVDHELSWIRPWLLRYQMIDGGLNCDNKAYLVNNEVPSSMVSTIAAFEAILLCTNRPWTLEEQRFLSRGAHFLIGRKLIYGSNSQHNVAEQQSAKDWLKPCFPRFYFYDSLRGLHALAAWSQRTRQKIPPDAIKPVVQYFSQRFINDEVRNERLSFENKGTLVRTDNGDWQSQKSAERFSLLEYVSAIGAISPYLSKQWRETKNLLLGLQMFCHR